MRVPQFMGLLLLMLLGMTEAILPMFYLTAMELKPLGDSRLTCCSRQVPREGRYALKRTKTPLITFFKRFDRKDRRGSYYHKSGQEEETYKWAESKLKNPKRSTLKPKPWDSPLNRLPGWM